MKLKQAFEDLKTDCIDTYDVDNTDFGVAFVISINDEIDDDPYNYVLGWLADNIEVEVAKNDKQWGNYARIYGEKFINKHFKMLSKFFDYGKTGMLTKALPALISGYVSEELYVRLAEELKKKGGKR